MGNKIENIKIFLDGYKKIQICSINKQKNFLKRHNSFLKRIENEKLLYYTNKYDRLLKTYNILMEDYSKENKRIAEDFNVFEILKIDRKEVITHSPIISNLLNPKAQHAQMDLFYNLFLETVIPEKNLIERFINTGNNGFKDYEVITEKQKFDIFVESLNPINPFAIIIENKIDSGDQNKQVKRYYDRIKQRYSDDNILFLYLTIHGNEPTTKSISKKQREKLIAKNVFRSISYKKEIKVWLEKSLEQDIAPIVKHTIEQYLKTIKTL